MTKDEKADLLVKKDYYHKKLVEVYGDIKELREMLTPLEDQYTELKQSYHSIDHKLALVDGRRTKITKIKKSVKKPIETPTDTLLKSMSTEELATLCKQLNLE
jgi:hypothetical protein